MNSSAKQEWFTAFELEGIGNLPNKATNITRRATKENWEKRQIQGKKGVAYEYHYSSLPPAVQQQLGFDITTPTPVNEMKGITNFNNAMATTLEQVPFYNTFASAGVGAVNTDVYKPDDYIGLSTQWLNFKGLHKSSLAFILADGDSMYPTISNGDMLLLDRSRNTLKDGKIYVVRSGDQLWVKRVQGIIGGIRLISDNKEIYTPVDVIFDDGLDFEVIGQVVFVGHDLI
ncbi:helix-turn-helix domain-containing protein [Mannheimia massilioguelmaensis]|uniref:helix-turn-helix domain-containing protein n=1 Tax=Mannheimia massilioguelmaensis TaxID=1604354 RepID=UPI0005CB6D93|nr:S24 family peptidase [Mannheimia massilioguelmaensis]